MAFTWGELEFGTGTGWGGIQHQTVSVTGVEATTATGTSTVIEGVGFEVTLAGWGRAEWGDNAWSVDYDPGALAGSTGSVALYTTNVFNTTGVESTFSTGALSFVGEANVALTGVQTTAALGDDGTVASAVVEPTGVSATTIPGASWGDAAWGNSLWGGNITFRLGQVISVERGSLEAVEATGAIGTVGMTGLANVELTGVSATAQLGDEYAFTNFTHAAIGLEATADLGASDEEVIADAVVIEDGVEGTGAIGGNTVVAKAVVLPTGVSSTASLGDETPIAAAVVVETGFGITATLAARSKIITVSKAVVEVTGVVGTTNGPKVTLWGGGSDDIPPVYTDAYREGFWSTIAA